MNPAPSTTTAPRRRAHPFVVLVATAGVMIAPAAAAGATPLGAAGPWQASTVELTTEYQCTDDVNPQPGYTVSIDQTTATPDSAPLGASAAVQVTALQLTFDDTGSTALRSGGATGISGQSSSYQFGYGDDQTGVLTMDGGLTVAEQPLGSEGGVRLGASATGGTTTMQGEQLRVYAPSFFDLTLTPSGGGTPLEVSCATNLDTLLATIAAGPAESGPSSTSRLVVGVLALVVIAGGLAALLRWRSRRAAPEAEKRDRAQVN